MRARTLTALSIASVFSLACLCGGGNSDREETATEDTFWDWDWDTDDTATEEIPILPSAGSYCDVAFDDGDWEAEPGYWVGKGTGSTSRINCIDDAGETTFDLVVEGNLENARFIFPVSDASYAQGVVSSWTFKYAMTGGEAEFVVDGKSSNGKYLWGHLEGSIELTDSMSDSVITVSDLELKSWPLF